jgi:hypothetical protein
MLKGRFMFLIKLKKFKKNNQLVIIIQEIQLIKYINHWFFYVNWTFWDCFCVKKI